MTSGGIFASYAVSCVRSSQPILMTSYVPGSFRSPTNLAIPPGAKSACSTGGFSEAFYLGAFYLSATIDGPFRATSSGTSVSETAQLLSAPSQDVSCSVILTPAIPTACGCVPCLPDFACGRDYLILELMTYDGIFACPQLAGRQSILVTSYVPNPFRSPISHN